MPVTKSAKKKLKQDKKRELRNQKLKKILKNSIKVAKKKLTEENLRKAFKAIDKAAKANIIHSNKAARIKSNLSKRMPKKQIKEVVSKKKTHPKKTAKKSLIIL